MAHEDLIASSLSSALAARRALADAERRIALVAAVELTPCLGRPPSEAALARHLCHNVTNARDTWARAQTDALATRGALARPLAECRALVRECVSLELAETTSFGFVLTARGRAFVEGASFEPLPF